MAWDIAANLKGPQGIQGIQGVPGTDGEDGAEGPQGPAGPGLPTGGTSGQIPVKASSTDFDVAWTNLPPTLVTSNDITTIEVVTQAAYDALTPVATTLYVIVG